MILVSLIAIMSIFFNASQEMMKNNKIFIKRACVYIEYG